MVENIGEGTLEIPGSWLNSSVNIFSAEEPGKLGPSLTVNRDRLQSGTTFNDYVKDQVARLEKQLSGFRLAEQRELEVCERPAFWFEFTWQTADGARMHQILLTVHGEVNVVNLVASHGRLMDETLRQQMQTILHSFRLLPKAG